jgi:4-hydroxy-2,2'-bipyrrole-5-carbaldehyde O-methyltransferase
MTALESLRHGRRLAATLAGQLRVSLLRTGIHQGLFEALREPKSAAELARRQGLAADLVEAWLRAAHAHGLLTLREGRYALGDFARWLLDAPDASALHAMLDQSELSWAPRLARLPDLMKGAERPVFGTPEEALRAAAAARLMEQRALAALARVPGARNARRVLDVGCGYGTYLAGLLRRHRDAYGLGVEIDPAVAEEARRVLREAEVWRRAEIRVGDFMSMELPTGSYDLALLNNDVHYFGTAERGALFRRVLERLRPGGTLAVQTPVVRMSRLARALGSAPLVATFDLYLRAHRNLAGLPDPAELAAALREAGFAEAGEIAIVPDRTAAYVWARSPAEPREVRTGEEGAARAAG